MRKCFGIWLACVMIILFGCVDGSNDLVLAPKATLLSPGNKAIDTSTIPEIKVHFTSPVQNVNVSTINLHEGYESGPLVSLEFIKYESASNTYTFRPSDILKQLTNYYVVIDNFIVDNSGHIVPRTIFSFTTKLLKWEYVGESGFSPENTSRQSLAIAPDNSPYVAYIEDGNGSKITVKRFNGKAWENVGSQGFTSGAANYPSLLLSSAGIPYVAYCDSSNSNKPVVVKFNGNNWETVGTWTGTLPSTSEEKLAITSDGVLYLGFKATVQGSIKMQLFKLGGNNWTKIGEQNFSVDTDNGFDLAISSKTKLPYISYADYSNTPNSYKITVSKFNEESLAWEPIGKTQFSEGAADYQSIALGLDNTPYIAYSDNGNLDKTTVMKYNGSSWETVGEAGFSKGSATYQNLAIDSRGVLYVAFKDDGNDSKTTVVRFNGKTWQNVGNEIGISPLEANFQSFKIAHDGTLYVAFQDTTKNNKTSVMKFNY